MKISNSMMKQRKIELLAPAKNLECGIEAVNHGADAVYIGAPKFGARAAAVNSLEDIAALTAYAHLYNVRIYVTVNTILKEEELAETEKMIWELYRIGVDALIVQDMGITRLNLPPIPLHGSTQMDNRTPEKVRFLADAGFRQVVLARELSLQEIRNIHEACPETPLEVFVHGALCVSYSGQCYVSQACFGRSANRGECAQFCRLPFSLVDADGKTIVRDKHLLSLKDLGQSVFVGLGKSRYAVFFSIFRKVIIVIPLILILPTIFHLGTDGILMAEPISNFIGGTACFGIMLCTVWRELGKKEKSNAQET